jgi:ribonuclease P protein component
MRPPAEGSADAADPSGEDARFPPSHRLRRRADFLRVQRSGARVHTPHFVVVVLPRAEENALRRVGITVTKKVAKAVGRNRVKRVLREVFRKNRELFPEACDLVIIAKSGAADLGYEQALVELERVRGAMAGAARRRRKDLPEAG